MSGDVEASDLEKFGQIIRHFEESVAFARRVGEKVEKIESGRAILYVDVEEGHLNGNDTLHGGVYATLIDSAMSLALRSLNDARIATTQMNVHFLGGADEGRITCRGEVLHRTRRTATAEARVYDEAGEILATGTGSFRVFEERGTPVM